MRIETYHDPDLGTIATAYDDDGNVVATASDYASGGVYTAVDEGAYYAATGLLLPVELWDAALLPAPVVQPPGTDEEEGT